MAAILVVSVALIVVQYVIPAWQMVRQGIGSTISVTRGDVSDTNGYTLVPAGEKVTVKGTDITLTGEVVSARELSQPFKELYIVTFQASRGGQTTNISLTRSQPSGYIDQPSTTWNGYRFTLIKAHPLGVQSATIQVQAQV